MSPPFSALKNKPSNKSARRQADSSNNSLSVFVLNVPQISDGTISFLCLSVFLSACVNKGTVKDS
jgi:hypothetical protein